MSSTDPKSMADLLYLAPPEKRLLQRIVSPDPPGRFKSLFQRPVRGASARDVVVAILILIGIVLGIVLFLWLLTAIDSLLGESTRAIIENLMKFILPVAVLIWTLMRNAKVRLLERLIRKLHGALEEGARQV